jgi:hypothetical protein
MSDLFGFTTGTYVDDYSGRMTTDYYDPSGYFVGATYQNPDGSGSWWNALSGEHGSFSGTTQYWEVGVALGFGFEIWGTSNGDMGFGWASGLGIIAEAGQTNTPQEALSMLSQNGGVVSFDADPFPSSVSFSNGVVSFDSLGINIGAYGLDQDNPFIGAPNWKNQFIDSIGTNSE